MRKAAIVSLFLFCFMIAGCATAKKNHCPTAVIKVKPAGSFVK